MEWSEYFYYDETSPTKLRWKVNRMGGHGWSTVSRREHSVAGNFHKGKSGYPMATCVKFKDKNYKVHRIIWELHHGPIPEGMVIDHLNGDPWDNKIENLACKTISDNCTNRKKRSDNKSGKTGVSLVNRNGKLLWCASFYVVDGRRLNRTFSVDKYGYYNAYILACNCRNEKIKELNLEGKIYTDRHGV